MLTKIKNNKIIIIIAIMFIVIAVILGIVIFKKDTNASVTTDPIKNVAEESVDDESINETIISTEDITTDDEDNLVIDTESDNVKIEDDVAVIKDDDGNEVIVAVKTEDGKTVVDTSKKVVKNENGEYETKSSDTPSVTVDTKGQVVVKNADDSTTTTKQTTTTKAATTKETTTTTKQTAKTNTTTRATTTKKVEETVEAPKSELGPTAKEPAVVATTTTKATTTAKVTEAPKTTTTKTTTKATTTTTTKSTEETTEKEVHVCDWRNAIPVYKDVPVSAWDEVVKKQVYSNKCHGCGLQEYYVKEAWNNKDEATLKKLVLTNVTDKDIINRVNNELRLLDCYYDSHELFIAHCDMCGGRGYGWTSSSVEVEQVIHHEETTKSEVEYYVCPECGKKL